MAITKRDEKGRIVSKLTPQLAEKYVEVLEEEPYAYALTQEEIIAKVNQKLPEEDRITVRAWSNYIKTAKRDDKDDPFLQALLERWVLMRADKKQYFLGKMENTNSTSWMRFGWMLERVFPEMTMQGTVRHEHEVTDKRIKQIVFKKPDQIEGAQEADFEEIE